MKLQQARQEFQVRYYRWALDDFRREIDEGFPLLRSVIPGRIWRFLALMKRVRREEQLQFASALVKRFHREAVAHTGESLTVEEERLVENYRNVMLMPTPEEQNLLELELSGRARFRVNRKKFAALIKEELVPILGGVMEPWDTHDYRYTTSMGSWTILTYCDTGGDYYNQLTYSHSISAAPHVYIQEHVNILSWLGISSQTTWSYLTDADTGRVAECLARLCEHFMKAAGRLLDGLSPM